MTSSIKTLVAAALVATAGSAAFAGPSYIISGNAQSLNSAASLDLVRADSDATVYIYDFHGGQRGELLGSAPVKAGANSDVFINLKRPANGDAIAVLSNGSELAVSDVNNIQ